MSCVWDTWENLVWRFIEGLLRHPGREVQQAGCSMSLGLMNEVGAGDSNCEEKWAKTRCLES